MRLRKIFYLIFTALFIFLALSFVSCKQSKLTITKPGENANLFGGFKNNIEDGNYGDLDISGGGTTITIKNTNGNGNDTTYKYVGKIGGNEEEGKISKYEDTTDTNKYLLAMQGENSTTTIETTKNGAEAIEKAFNEFGEEKSLNIVMDMQKAEFQNADGSPDLDKIADKYNMSGLERQHMKDYFRGLGKDDFGTPTKYDKTS